MSVQPNGPYSTTESVPEDDNYDLAASHLAARQMQTRVLLICSVLGVAGLAILAVCLASANSPLAPADLPGLSNS